MTPTRVFTVLCVVITFAPFIFVHYVFEPSVRPFGYVIFTLIGFVSMGFLRFLRRELGKGR